MSMEIFSGGFLKRSSGYEARFSLKPPDTYATTNLSCLSVRLDFHLSVFPLCVVCLSVFPVSIIIVWLVRLSVSRSTQLTPLVACLHRRWSRL
jgi:hypothetical protein